MDGGLHTRKQDSLNTNMNGSPLFCELHALRFKGPASRAHRANRF